MRRSSTHLARRRRGYFGLALAAAGRFREAGTGLGALETSARASRPRRRPRSPVVERLRQAALTLDLALGAPVTEDIRALTAQFAADPSSLVFLRLGEALAAARPGGCGAEGRPAGTDTVSAPARCARSVRPCPRRRAGLRQRLRRVGHGASPRTAPSRRSQGHRVPVLSCRRAGARALSSPIRRTAGSSGRRSPGRGGASRRWTGDLGDADAGRAAGPRARTQSHAGESGRSLRRPRGWPRSGAAGRP